MDIYQKKERMILSRSIQRRKRYIEVASENNDAIRLLLSKEKGVHFGDNKAYMPAEDFVLTKFFNRYVGLAFIDEKYRKAYQPEMWLFEREVRIQFSESIVSKKLKEIAHEAGITKRGYPHLFRHSFATHLIEQGTDLKIIKKLLGHNNIRTTEMYVHIADTYKSKIKSPLDDILEGEI